MKIFINTTFFVDHGLYGKVNDLYNEKKLLFRIKTLKYLTLPSIQNQINKNFIHRIFYSNFIPLHIINQLKDLQKTFFFELIGLERGREAFFNALKNNLNNTINEIICQMNVDDDDAIAPWLVDYIIKFAPDENCLLTFPLGVLITFENEDSEVLETLSKVSKHNYNCIHLGLTLCSYDGMTTYELSNHTKIKQNFPLLKIIELNFENKFAWIRSESSTCHHKTYHPKSLHNNEILRNVTLEKIFSI